MENALTSAHGKVGRSGSTDPVDADKGPASGGAEKEPVDEPAESINDLSVRVHQAQQEGGPVADTELIDLLANLNITPGKPADEAATRAAEIWATVKDQEDVVEAMRLDAVDEMTAQLNGTHLDVEDVSEDEKEDGGGESRGRGREAREGTRHRPTLHFRRTSAIWRGQGMRAAMETPPSAC